MFTLKKVTSIILWSILGLSFILGLATWMGPEAVPGEPKMTDTLLYFTYFLFGATVLLTIVLSGMQIADKIKYDKSVGIKFLAIIGGVIVLGFVSYALADGTPLNIPGYTGTENVAFWLQWTDVMLFVMYFFFIGAIGLLLFSEVYRVFKK